MFRRWLVASWVALTFALPRVGAADDSPSTGRWAKSLIRAWVVHQFGDDEKRTRYGLELDADWQKTPVEKGLVILVHGFQSRPERHDSILKEVRATGIPCGVLRYPNDQPLEKSAALLAAELKRVCAAQAERRITLLTLSMGGLIGRAVIEDASLDPGNVRRLLMVGTPNHGSRMAQFAVGADAWEFLVRSPEGSLTKRWYAAVEDGLGEAATDMAPGSDFLRALNRRDLNAKVEYSLFLGTGGPVQKSSQARWRERLQRYGDRSALARWFTQPTQRVLDDLDEVVAGRGDGAVAVKRGRLKGVDDTLVLDFAHHELMDGDGEASRKLRAELLRRITK